MSFDLSADQFDALFRQLSNWRRWGENDERGALHHLTPEHWSPPRAWSGMA